MRTCVALLCSVVLLACPFFFAYLEAERLLGWPDTMYLWFDAWLPVAMAVMTSFIALALPCIVALYGNPEHRSRNLD